MECLLRLLTLVARATIFHVIKQILMFLPHRILFHVVFIVYVVFNFNVSSLDHNGSMPLCHMSIDIILNPLDEIVFHSMIQTVGFLKGQALVLL
jgi:hypothetical protein